MGNKIPFANAKVPLVGQQIVIHNVVIMAQITCNCAPGTPPILLRGIDAPAYCSRCGNVYQLVRCMYDARQGPGILSEIATIGKATPVETPKSETPEDVSKN